MAKESDLLLADSIQKWHRKRIIKSSRFLLAK